MKHQAHVTAFIKAKYGLFVEASYITYFVYVSDPDYDSPRGCDDNSAFLAALDYADCYDDGLSGELAAKIGRA